MSGAGPDEHGAPHRSAVSDGWRLAVGTLTALPVGAPQRVDAAVARAGMLLAPVAALLLAALPLAAHVLVRLVGMPPLLAAALTLAALALGTRGLHLDGLADTADGFAASYDRERALEVMRRGDTGPAGVAAVVLTLLVQVGALSALLASWPGAVLAATAVVSSRHTLAWLCGRWLPAARAAGLGAAVAGSVPVAAAATVALAVALLSAGLGWIVGGPAPWAGALVPVGVAAAAMVGLRARHRLGGITGDILGAGVEVSLAAALTVAACLH